jgi:hypothetical protein
MSPVAASIDTMGLARMSGAVRRAVTGGLQSDLVDSLHAAQAPILGDIRSAASTRIQQHAAASVAARRTSDGIELEGGTGGGLDAILFNGGEYGGRKTKKITYATRSPLGRAYPIRRRTTMQFLPHLGRDGYMFWPTVREWMPKLVEEQERILGETLGGT